MTEAERFTKMLKCQELWRELTGEQTLPLSTEQRRSLNQELRNWIKTNPEKYAAGMDRNIPQFTGKKDGRKLA